CDAGIDLTLSELTAAAAHLSDKVGLVLALKTGDRPENFAAEMECSYINGHQARFLTAADRLRMPVASGGVTILTRDTLQRIGGHQGFLNYLADDYSVVRMVRDRLGQTTWLARVMPRLLVGGRRWQGGWGGPGPLGSAAGPLWCDAAEAQPRGEGARAAGARDRLARVGPCAGRGAACRRRRTRMAFAGGRPAPRRGGRPRRRGSSRRPARP